MRIRTIKPEFWSHPVMTKLPYDTRILALGLLNLADDEGYFDADPDYIRGAVLFREDSTNVRRMLDELSRSGWITLSGTDERPIGQVCTFRKHQRVDRPQPSRLKQYALAEDSSNVRRAIDDRSLQEQGTGKGKDTPIVPLAGDCAKNAEGNAESEDESADLVRCRRLFRMREGTALDAGQSRAWRKAERIVSETTNAEWDQLEAYYAAELARKDDYRRRDLATLLNNWLGEITRAAEWCARSGFSAAQNREKNKKGWPDDSVWREVLLLLYPTSDPGVYADWSQVPESLREEILRGIEQARLAQEEAA